MPASTTTPADSLPQRSAAPARRALALFALLLVVLFGLAMRCLTSWCSAVKRRPSTPCITSPTSRVRPSRPGWKNACATPRRFPAGDFSEKPFIQWVSGGVPDDGAREQVLEQLLAIRDSFGYIEVAVVDPFGNPYLSTGAAYGAATMLDSPLAIATVQEAISLNRPRLSPIHAGGGPDPDRRVVDIAAPLVDLHERNGKVPSILLVRADAGNQFDPIVKAMPLMNTATEVFLAEIVGGQVMATWSSRNALHFTAFGPLPLEPDTLADAATEVRALDLSSPHGDSVAVVRPVPGTPWYLVTTLDQEATRGERRSRCLAGRPGRPGGPGDRRLCLAPVEPGTGEPLPPARHAGGERTPHAAAAL